MGSGLHDATVVLARHGETTWNRERRIQGWAPTSLTDTGREQATALGRHLTDAYDVGRVVASDLRRTRETARPVARLLDCPVEYEHGWRERSFGVYQGLTYEEVFERHPEFAVHEIGIEAARTEPEGGESLLAARERVLDAWNRLVAALDDGETVVVVTHGGPLYVLLGHLRGQDLVTALTEHDQGNCAVSTVRLTDEGPVVVCDGDTAYRESGATAARNPE
ncbi:histidine phosphatase family protein [Haloarchaeobius iranensis]|uniref:Probable phosphoglycerate mutase n=1 Tax=Haloarchaeobius iranensis TaxID=996166 RepID=A0A1G9S8P5_9EURY|nr:histidine phosphatase family protein [Haloarchaeobius iranensis]SDM31826.1 probable phosphoglycerate mutase [Haloarchaeobius iranensis]